MSKIKVNKISDLNETIEIDVVDLGNMVEAIKPLLPQGNSNAHLEYEFNVGPGQDFTTLRDAYDVAESILLYTPKTEYKFNIHPYTDITGSFIKLNETRFNFIPNTPNEEFCDLVIDNEFNFSIFFNTLHFDGATPKFNGRVNFNGNVIRGERAYFYSSVAFRNLIPICRLKVFCINDFASFRNTTLHAGRFTVTARGIVDTVNRTSTFSNDVNPTHGFIAEYIDKQNVGNKTGIPIYRAKDFSGPSSEYIPSTTISNARHKFDRTIVQLNNNAMLRNELNPPSVNTMAQGNVQFVESFPTNYSERSNIQGFSSNKERAYNQVIFINDTDFYFADIFSNDGLDLNNSFDTIFNADINTDRAIMEVLDWGINEPTHSMCEPSLCSYNSFSATTFFSPNFIHISRLVIINGWLRFNRTSSPQRIIFGMFFNSAFDFDLINTYNCPHIYMGGCSFFRKPGDGGIRMINNGEGTRTIINRSLIFKRNTDSINQLINVNPNTITSLLSMTGIQGISTNFTW